MGALPSVVCRSGSGDVFLVEMRYSCRVTYGHDSHPQCPIMWIGSTRGEVGGHSRTDADMTFSDIDSKHCHYDGVTLPQKHPEQPNSA